ncbi:hypothetical protein GGS21DRAFT_506135 [Xylaria nigripes]|nr:hypothetical protein GGS21DRAFT_506135 [Xylaria nigripes]
MKFGDRLNEVSVPGWSVHNVDYDSLKHQIKAHTTKDRATSAAIAIPGHQDHALQKFEDAFYLDLCSEHNRIGLFVTSKTDEISRRLRHISGLVRRLLLKSADRRVRSDKSRQQRFAKYAAQTEECRHDIEALVRFVETQITGFHKILKKYKKWTGSPTLTSRFKNNVLQSPKSFTRYDFSPLRLQHQELRTALASAPPSDDGNGSETPTPSEAWDAHGDCKSPGHESQPEASSIDSVVTPTTYWNEYEHGSENGCNDEDGAYLIYIEPDADENFPGVAYVKSVFGAPVDQVRHWLHSQKPKDLSSKSPTMVGSPSETHSLLGHNRNRSNSTITNYFSIGSRQPPTDPEAVRVEDDCLSSEGSELQRHAYPLQVSSPFASTGVDTKVSPYQELVLTRSIVLAFVAAFMLLGISGLLVVTGRRSLRLEVDIGAAGGSVASLLCACMGLATMLYRQYPSGYSYSLAVWATFVVVCTLNGALLVTIVSSSGAF